METTIDDSKIKDIFKQASIEAIEEKKDVVHDMLVDALEDVAMIRAIEDGENSDLVSKSDILKILESKEVSQ